MLRLLRVRDFALIRELEIEFGPGLCLLTGETGSGKSIIVDALGLLTGERSSQEMVRSQSDTAVVEGMFSVDGDAEALAAVQAAGIKVDEGIVLVRREVSLGGRGRVFVNDSLATVGLLRVLGSRLVDIHGQNDRLTLLDLASHLQWLDRFADCGDLLQPVRDSHQRAREIHSKLNSQNFDEQERLRRIDMLRFQVEEIRRVNPGPEEKAALESERQILANRERIASLAAEAYAILYESEGAALSGVNRVHRILQDLEHFDPGWTGHREAIREALFRLEDSAYALRDYCGKLEHTPGRLDWVEGRLSEIERLTRKYGPTTAAVLEHVSRCEEELLALEGVADRRRHLQEELKSELECYRAAAERLSARRRTQAGRFEHEVGRELASLAMERTVIKISFGDDVDTGTEAQEFPAWCGSSGMDNVQFLISPNRGEELRPLSRIASGGELSRMMLAIKTLCGAGSGATTVFDEVDSGIGGRVAEAVGRRLRAIARGGQVLCVTHLPQIAAFADQHYSVWKEVRGGRTETFATPLGPEARLEEIARMLGGQSITDTARNHARELVEQAVKGRSRSRD